MQMKTDYAALGKDSLACLRSTIEKPEAIQRQLLIDLMQRNRRCAYGRKYGFETIDTIEEYQKRVPISTYTDYEPYILQVVEGAKQVLTEDETVYFCITSGTTGAPKYLPLTAKEFDLHYLYAYGAVFGMVREFYKDLPETEIFGKIFQIGEFAKTTMQDGRMNGIRSGSLYQWLDRQGKFDASDYCVPKNVLFPDKLENLIYVKVRFALAQRDISAIHGVFVNRVVGIMDYIYTNWDMLLADMEQGSVNERVELSEEWRKFIIDRLPSNPSRAQELQGFSYQGLPRGMIKKLWPGIKYILAIGGKAFSNYMDRMKEYAEDIPIHYFAYAASEGIFGIARKMNEPDAYILLPEAGFFEFLPLEDDDDISSRKSPYLMWEICCGKQYELLFTNHSGLYRYRVGDVVEVIDWYGKTPVVRFSYRKNQMLNIAGEKSSMDQIEDAVSRFTDKMELTIKGYCVQEDIFQQLPRYLFYIEYEGQLPGDAEKVLEDCLCKANFEYQECRSINEIGPLQIERLRQGSFERYERYLAALGTPMGQNKPLRLLDSEEKKKFFFKETVGRKEG